MHYGDTTLTFLNNLYRADQRGTGAARTRRPWRSRRSRSSTTTRATPTGSSIRARSPAPPRVPLVAIYPKEGTLFSDNPFIVLDAPWVDATRSRRRSQFQDFVQQPDNQERVLQYGFRPGNPSVRDRRADRRRRNGVDPNQPQTPLELPGAAGARRHPRPVGPAAQGSARVLLVIDVSGSMGEPAADSGETKLDLAKQAAIAALDQFKPDDEVGLWVFSHRHEPRGTRPTTSSSCRSARSARSAQRSAATIDDLVPTQGTPLYTVDEGRRRPAGRRRSTPPASTRSCCSPTARTTTTKHRRRRTAALDRGAATRAQVANPVRLFTDRLRQDARPACSGASPRPPTPPLRRQRPEEHQQGVHSPS